MQREGWPSWIVVGRPAPGYKSLSFQMFGGPAEAAAMKLLPALSHLPPLRDRPCIWNAPYWPRPRYFICCRQTRTQSDASNLFLLLYNPLQPHKRRVGKAMKGAIN